MNKACLLASILICFAISTHTVPAASLEKYGNTPYKYQPATPAKSKRERAIEKAVAILNSKPANERKRLIANYQARIKNALDHKRYDEADFYTQILRQANRK